MPLLSDYTDAVDVKDMKVKDISKEWLIEKLADQGNCLTVTVNIDIQGHGKITRDVDFTADDLRLLARIRRSRLRKEAILSRRK